MGEFSNNCVTFTSHSFNIDILVSKDISIIHRIPSQLGKPTSANVHFVCIVQLVVASYNHSETALEARRG